MAYGQCKAEVFLFHIALRNMIACVNGANINKYTDKLNNAYTKIILIKSTHSSKLNAPKQCLYTFMLNHFKANQCNVTQHVTIQFQSQQNNKTMKM